MAVARSAGLPFVPAVFPARSGLTWVEHAGRLWDLTTWLPGEADFHQRPSPARLAAACRALAALHQSWAAFAADAGPSPGLARRQQLIDEVRSWVAAGWRPRPAPDDPVGAHAGRAWHLVTTHLEPLPARLRPWTGRSWPLQLCLGDIWHDHVLYVGDQVSGLVDYGGVKRETVAADLARLLGSMVGDDAAARAAGLRAYTQVHPLAPAEEELVAVLDESGAVLGLANWLKWLYREGRPFDDRSAVARRVAELVRRLEGW
jgi:Ser/Thr protein kinase RdoA (MazF antagonist)